ncbi:probable Rho GTPase-activating protein CG5521 isoform X2 [Cylas formicarius]|uniref:probable Rho GTPase-activating protein CG5521 isoform X2 n=1 Tax=Cylas formicarius TaxID=197179 RepID=UPI0029586688|nr:probable Rho GTPase-activating protein CG5521 isoform X2 [Cylas formicarius]
MFTKRNLVDVKKSTSKLQDPKKDVATRIKHLKLILENVDTAEAKGLFEANFSHIYIILYESFLQTESNLKQRELSFHLVPKAHKEELECSLWILEQVISLLPELIHQRWQLHSLGRIMAQLLHPGNSLRLRKQGIKYFLMWYQALNENTTESVDCMFASLVPGFGKHSAHTFPASESVFHDDHYPVTVSELVPIFPPSSGEKTPEHPGRFYLEVLLDYMVQTVVKLEWQDKLSHHHRCFGFLMEKFRHYYLPVICPNFAKETSLYRPNLDLPVWRKFEQETEYVLCRVSLIIWVTNYLSPLRKGNETAHNIPQLSASQSNKEDDEDSHDSPHPSLDSNISVQSNKTKSEEKLASQIVRDVLYCNQDNVNFVHELYRQAFLLNFSHVIAIRKIIAIYKDLIQGNVAELPVYALEPPDELTANQQDVGSIANRGGRLRNDSYLGAIHKENLLVRAGVQNVYQLFVTHAANVFLLEVDPKIPRILEEQTDACKRVLNIYRYMVMNSRMDSNTWEQLLLVLLQITLLVLGDGPPKRKLHSLGGKLAPAIFQTLIVTWIKANLNVAVSRELWDRFLDILTSLTNWEELIKEWAKTMETLTRVLARHVYNLDLTDLPLDRLNDQKSKKTKRFAVRQENYNSNVNSAETSRQDPSLPDGNLFSSKRIKPGLSRSYSDVNLNARTKGSHRGNQKKNRRSKSLEIIPPHDVDLTDRSRSPSPAPSSGLECSSVKDSPIQLDMDSSEKHTLEPSEEHRGIICGGSVRGWLPDVAVILWKRMLGALGDVNQICDPKHHHQVFEYLNKLTNTLIKIKLNQGVSGENTNLGPGSPELIPPVVLILPWCFGALSLPDDYEAGKQIALKILITVMLNCDEKHRTYLPQFYSFIHTALTGASKLLKFTSIKYLGPRFISFHLPGSSLLLLDLVVACNDVINASEIAEAAPRCEAISILTNLLSLPEDPSSISVLQPETELTVIENCPDIKDHVVSILLRAGKREPTSRARCLALSGLGIFVYKELANQTFHSKVTEAISVLLQALKFNNRAIAQIASDHLFLLCNHASLLHKRYPIYVQAIIAELCGALSVHAPSGTMAVESDRVLVAALLLCLGEWCMRLGPRRLLEEPNSKGSCLLLQVFTVLHRLISSPAPSETRSGSSHGSGDFDPNIFSEYFKKSGNPMVKESTPDNTKCHRDIALCAETVLAHIVGHLGHFPMAVGAARLSSLVSEYDDVPNYAPSDNLTFNIFLAPNVQLLILSKNIIASLIELPTLDLPGGGVTAGLVTADRQVRILFRDLLGKSSWDASILYKVPDEVDSSNQETLPNVLKVPDCLGDGTLESFVDATLTPQILPQRAIRHRPPDMLPELSNAASDLDQLDDLLQYLGYTSPECLECSDRKLNEPACSPVSVDIEQEAIATVISQRNVEAEEVRLIQHVPLVSGQPLIRIDNYPNNHSSDQYQRSTFMSNTQEEGSLSLVQVNTFHQCRMLFSQLSLAGWERRKQLHLLDKTERLLRELRNLDNQTCRETHKFAVIYVAPGQEDKTSILANQSGSVAYEQFVAALAWEIELEIHTGFLGGLQRQGSTGVTAPYMATSFMEAIFHVATRMPGDTKEAVLNKTKHLGNDEVHIVWSEHNRDYRRDIIPTEFCDVLITIYPLGNNLNRVTVNCKEDVPQFGVVFNEAVVESNILAALVRTTAVCASRAKRTTYKFYQQFYEERWSSLDTVVTKHKYSTTYEEFLSKMYSPGIEPSPFCSTESLSVSTDGTSGSSSMLAAALLDSAHGYAYRSGSKVDQKFRVSGNEQSRMLWFNGPESHNVDSNISPRPLKKLSENLKNSRKSLKQESSVESPPESPLPAAKKK